MKNKSFISTSLILLLIIFGPGCNTTSTINNQPQSSTTETPSETAKIEVLNITVIPHQSGEIEQNKIDKLAEYLKETLGISVNITISKSYDESIDLLVSEKVEIAFLSAFAYIKAKELNPNLEAILAPIDKNTGRPWYNSVIVANTEKGITKVEDIKTNKSKFSFVSESSTSGYLIPLNYLKSLNINPKIDFAKVEYGGSHDQNLLTLTSGKVDAIAIDKKTYMREEKLGKIDTAKYKIIWESDPIPNPPIVINNQLPAEFIVEFKKVLINAPEGLVDVTGAESSGYTLVQDEDYEHIRQMKQRLGL